MSKARILADYVAGGTTAAEFDVLDGLTSTTAELNYVDGVTSNVQTQMNDKAPKDSPTFTGTTTISGDLVPSSALSNRNHLINGDFQVNQRWPSYTAGDNNDDTYVLDRWYLLSDSNNVVDVTQSSTAPTNQLYSIGLDVETANKKFGIAQIIENKNCVGLIGNNVTFSFKAKVSATTKLDNVKAGIIAWSGTADSVTSDVVSAWAVEGTNPTLAPNLTFENTPANLNVTTSWATYSVSANIDTSSTTNVIVFIWSDVTDTSTGDFLYITDCQLEQGSNATPFEHRSYADELQRCQRYMQAWCNGATSDQSTTQLFVGQLYSTTFIQAPITLPTAMRTTPTISSSGDGTFRMYSGSATATCGPVIIDGPGQDPDAITCALSVSNLSITNNGAGAVRSEDATAHMFLLAEL